MENGKKDSNILRKIKRMVDQFRLYDELYGKPWEEKMNKGGLMNY